MSTDDFLRRWPVDPEVARAFDQIPNELNEMGYDQWGFHPETAKRLYSIGRWVYRYFRPQIRGVDNIPSGRVLLIGNHSGQLPFDGLVVAVATLLHAAPPRIVRAMAERWFPTLPIVNEVFVRAGVTVGDPINARNLLEHENAILVFPEGTGGSGKVFQRRYRLAKFGRGFMRLALQTRTPIVPFDVIGAEESIPSVYNAKRLAKLLAAPYFPVPMTLPLLGPLAYLPLPTRFHVRFGEPLHFKGPFDDEDEIVDAKVDVVKERIQAMIDEDLAARRSIF